MRQHRWDSVSELISQFGAKSGIEVGVQRGINMSHLLSRYPDLYITGVDGWDKLEPVVGSEFDKERHANHYRMAREAVRPFGSRALLICALSEEAANKIKDESVDFVFIDADHSYEGCKRDIELWLPKVKPGGFICGHDYQGPHYEGVTRAVDESFDDVNALDCTKERSKVWWVEV